MNYVLAVGIEKYDDFVEITGPCANALAITEWVLSIGVPPANVFVFLDPIDPSLYKDAVTTLRAKGVDISEDGKWPAIDNFCFKILPEAPQEDSRLLMFWSGHGCIEDGTGNRFFICRDYTNDDYPNRVFNASLFLRHLRSNKFHRFSQSLLLADVCGAYQSVNLMDPRRKPAEVGDAKQLGYFATPEGEYAHGEDGRGAFTSVALAALRRSEEWPDLDTFETFMSDELAKTAGPQFCVVATNGMTEKPPRVAGAAPKGTPIDDLVARLNARGVPFSRYQIHYAQTVSNLGNPGLNKAQGVTGMIRELESLRERHGLLEFLVRLQQEPPLVEPVDDWLNANAALGELATIRADLANENSARILIVEIESNQNGEFQSFEPYLRTPGMMPITDPHVVSKSVKDWDDFEAKLRNLITALGAASISQIHFLLDPPLFDKAFHFVPAPDGSTLGEQFVVLIRHRGRLRSKARQIREKWEEYANAVRPSVPKELKVIPLPSNPNDPVGKLRGLCYLNQLIPLAGQSEPCSLQEKQLLLKLLKLGVPYMCWVHLQNPDWKCLEGFLSKCLNDVQTLDLFPSKFWEARVLPNQYASQATLLWDDPLIDPF